MTLDMMYLVWPNGTLCGDVEVLCVLFAVGCIGVSMLSTVR